MNTVEKPVDYDTDSYEWTRQQARLIAEGRFDEGDIPNLREEIESLGGAQLSAVRSLVTRILVHLLYLQFLQFSPRPYPRRHWRSEIGLWRSDIEERLDEDFFPEVEH